MPRLRGGDALQVEEQASLMSARSVHPQPDTITKLVKRVRLMILKLLPVEVDADEITNSTSSIITPEVIDAFASAGGDFSEAIPFALLLSRAQFLKEAKLSPADFDENMCRSTAAEVLARRIVHTLPFEKQTSVMSARYRWREADGDISAPVSALETAIDQSAIQFLSSSECENVINALWRGQLVARYGTNDDVEYVPYSKDGSGSFRDHLSVHRLQVPRYQNLFSTCTWLLFLFIYSQAVQSPLDSQDPTRLSAFEWILYLMAVSFLLDGTNRLAKRVRLSSNPWSAFGFWAVVDLIIQATLMAALGLRLGAIFNPSEDKMHYFHLRSFQVLSMCAPLIWIKLITVFDSIKFIGTMQIIVFRMLRDSAIFAVLLAIMAAGFMQALYALDAADGETAEVGVIFNSLAQALLGSPDFDTPSERFGYPFGLIIYYGWNVVGTVILLNILIALYNDSFSRIEEDATDYFMSYYAGKTIQMIRGPDMYYYPPPLNLVEIFIAPLDWVVSPRTYGKINGAIMSVLFAFPLAGIALFEAQMNVKHSRRMQRLLGTEEGQGDDEDDERAQNPECGDDDEGDISRKDFEELISSFPNTALSTAAVLQQQILDLSKKVEQLTKRLESEGRVRGTGEKAE